MVPRELLGRVLADVRRHCEGKGHREGPGEIGKTYIAEDCLDWGRRDEDEREFVDFFENLAPW